MLHSGPRICFKSAVSSETPFVLTKRQHLGYFMEDMNLQNNLKRISHMGIKNW